jgi:hypothetical protein
MRTLTINAEITHFGLAECSRLWSWECLCKVVSSLFPCAGPFGRSINRLCVNGLANDRARLEVIHNTSTFLAFSWIFNSSDSLVTSKNSPMNWFRAALGMYWSPKYVTRQSWNCLFGAEIGGCTSIPQLTSNSILLANSTWKVQAKSSHTHISNSRSVALKLWCMERRSADRMGAITSVKWTL